MNDDQSEEIEKLFKAHHRALCRLAYGLVKDDQAAQDIVQDVFVKIWKNRKSILFGSQIRHYLFRATSHAALNYLRFHKKLVSIGPADVLDMKASSPAPDEVDYKSLEAKIEQAINNLPERCRAVFVLSRQQGLKYQEIADSLGLSVKTVENQMGIALQKLREQLRPFLGKDIWVVLLIGAAVAFFVFRG